MAKIVIDGIKRTLGSVLILLVKLFLMFRTRGWRWMIPTNHWFRRDGIGAVLYHQMPDKREQPIANSSKQRHGKNGNNYREGRIVPNRKESPKCRIHRLLCSLITANKIAKASASDLNVSKAIEYTLHGCPQNLNCTDWNVTNWIVIWNVFSGKQEWLNLILVYEERKL